MKRTTSVVALAALMLFAASALIHAVGKHGRLVADGAPPPPWPPKPSGYLVADGAPPPPWPKLSSFLVADGAPPPPWPPSPKKTTIGGTTV